MSKEKLKIVFHKPKEKNLKRFVFMKIERQFHHEKKIFKHIFFHRLPQPQLDRTEKLELVIQPPKVVEEKSTRTSS